MRNATVVQPLQQRAQNEKERSLLLDQLRRFANLVSMNMREKTSLGDGADVEVWLSGPIDQNTVWNVTVYGRSTLPNFTDSGRFVLDYTVLRAAGAAAITRSSVMAQPIGAETMFVDIVDNKIRIGARDDARTIDFAAWTEVR